MTRAPNLQLYGNQHTRPQMLFILTKLAALDYRAFNLHQRLSPRQRPRPCWLVVGLCALFGVWDCSEATDKVFSTCINGTVQLASCISAVEFLSSHPRHPRLLGCAVVHAPPQLQLDSSRNNQQKTHLHSLSTFHPRNTVLIVIMRPLAPHPNSPKPLPQVPGPKLASFTQTGHAALQFLEELGDGSTSADSRVWKVKIQRKEPYYALKVVSPLTGQ